MSGLARGHTHVTSALGKGKGEGHKRRWRKGSLFCTMPVSNVDKGGEGVKKSDNLAYVTRACKQRVAREASFKALQGFLIRGFTL